MSRKGLSFTLTLVVVGVVLLMTALTVVTLGGSSLSNFFGFFEERGDEAATEAEIQEACNTRAGEIQSEYCDRYVATAEYVEGDGWEDGAGGEENPQTGYQNESDDTWESVNRGTACSGNQLIDRQVQNYESASTGDGRAYEQTASSRSCEWETNHDASPIVTVQGDEYNCLDRGYIDSQCPVQ